MGHRAFSVCGGASCKENKDAFQESCEITYGKPKKQTQQGLKFLSSSNPIAADKKNNALGSTDIRVYLSTGKVMTQGNCYMQRHTDHSPYLLVRALIQ